MMRAAKETTIKIINNNKCNMLQRVKIMNKYENRLRLCRGFVKQYNLDRQIKNYDKI